MTPARALFTLVVSLALPLFAATTPPYLVKDLPGPIEARDSLGTFWTTVGNTSWFTADAGDGQGMQVWKTDGTEAGTVRVTTGGLLAIQADTFLGAINGRIIYAGHDPYSNVLVALDENGGPPEVIAGGLFTEPGIVYQGVLYLVAAAREGNADKGIELWRTDGTFEGTWFVDLNNGPGSSLDSFRLFVAGDWMFFAGRTAAGNGIFRTDGTIAGTSMAMPWPAGIEPHFSQLTPFGDRAVFVYPQFGTDNNQLWVTDGDPESTFPLIERSSAYAPLGVLDGRLLFTIKTPGSSSSMWTTDGTIPGTRRLNDHLGPIGSIGIPGAAAGGKFFFFSLDPQTGQRGLFTTGALPNTTQKLIDVDNLPIGGIASNDRFYFANRTAAFGLEWWVSDGTVAGTYMVADIAPGSSNGAIAGQMLVRPDGVLVGARGPNGREPWLVNETGARMVKNIAIDTPRPGSSPEELRATDGRLFFMADGPGYRVVGRAEGIHPTTTTEVITPTDDWWNSDTLAAGGRYYLQAGGNLLSTDGTPAGTQRLSSNAGKVLVMGHGVVFEERSDNSFRFSDGTIQGTSVIAPLNGSATGWTLYSANDLAWFTNGATLAVSDGRSPMRRVQAAVTMSPIREVVHGPGATYFVDEHNDGTKRLWRTDGTDAGTRIVTVFASRPSSFITVADKLMFAIDGVLWATDGSVANTRSLNVPAPLPGCISGSGNAPAVLGNQLFWYVRRGNGTASLYKSDGTPAGTAEVTAFPTSAPGCVTMAAFDHHVYFRGYDAAHGTELWVTNGTAAGTRMVVDLYPGTAGSDPQELTVAGANLFFTAGTPDLARELWAIRQLTRRRAVSMP